MIKPTVGRIVWYGGGQGDKLKEKAVNNPLAALVTRVIDDKTVNLVIFDPDGGFHFGNSVPLVQEDKDWDPEKPFCTWMPCQIGQAKKTEAEGGQGKKLEDLEALVKLLDEHLTDLGEKFDKLANRVAEIEVATDASKERSPKAETKR